LFQSWQVALKRQRTLFKLLAITIIALLIGTLPLVDNFGHVGGFFFGIPLSIIFLPYINFGSARFAHSLTLRFLFSFFHFARSFLVLCRPYLLRFVSTIILSSERLVT
jgi:hypothetical protein